MHGANRLGTNSLGDLIVFGRRAGIEAAKFAAGESYRDLPAGVQDRTRELVDRSVRTASARSACRTSGASCRTRCRTTRRCSAPNEFLSKQVDILSELQERYKRHRRRGRGPPVQHRADRGDRARLPARQRRAAGARRPQPQGVARRALARGLHKERDDATWLKHTLVYKDGDGVRIDYKPVTLGKYEPKPRTY
jgi:succinate dehydrogenase / fumarate reductase, flavoprotein subunit